MATCWLLSLGFCIAMSALFTKLWRINRLFGQSQFRHAIVRTSDVTKPFAILFSLNVIFLVAWTSTDPLRWVRMPVPNQPWNTYGTCASNGPVGTAMMCLILIINLTALLLAGWQSCKARNVDAEFSEAKWLAIGIFSWVQVVIVGVPVLFLISNDNPTARYFLLCALVFAVCMSMMCLIFIPIILAQLRGKTTGTRVRSRVSTNRRRQNVQTFQDLRKVTAPCLEQKSTKEFFWTSKRKFWRKRFLNCMVGTGEFDLLYGSRQTRFLYLLLIAPSWADIICSSSMIDGLNCMLSVNVYCA
jgi:hypothetical protein